MATGHQRLRLQSTGARAPEARGEPRPRELARSDLTTADVLALQRSAGNAAVATFLTPAPARVLQRGVKPPRNLKSVRENKGWEDATDEEIKGFYAWCSTEAQVRAILGKMSYDDWFWKLKDTSAQNVPSDPELLDEYLENLKTKKLNVEASEAAKRTQAAPSFDKKAHIEKNEPSTALAGALAEQELEFAQIAPPDQRLLISQDADLLGASGGERNEALSTLKAQVLAIKTERQREAAHAQARQAKQTLAAGANAFLATNHADVLGNALLASVWAKAMDVYVNDNPMTTLDGEYSDAEIATAVPIWRRAKNRLSHLHVRNLHVPGGAEFIQDKSAKDISRGARRREARGRQTDFISIWSGQTINVHVDASG